MKQPRRSIPGLFLTLVLAGCSSQPATLVAPQSGAVIAAPGADTAADTSAADGAGASLPEAPAPSAAAIALLDQSRAQRERGDLGAAAATIERALSIAPDDAILWIELAELRRDQGDPAAAAEMARKALTLTNSNSTIARRARRLLP